jgi:hypothetical protein
MLLHAVGGSFEAEETLNALNARQIKQSFKSADKGALRSLSKPPPDVAKGVVVPQRCLWVAGKFG